MNKDTDLPNPCQCPIKRRVPDPCWPMCGETSNDTGLFQSDLPSKAWNPLVIWVTKKTKQICFRQNMCPKRLTWTHKETSIDLVDREVCPLPFTKFHSRACPLSNHCKVMALKCRSATKSQAPHLLKADHAHESLTLAVTSECRRIGRGGLPV